MPEAHPGQSTSPVSGRWDLMVAPDGRAPGAVNAGGPDHAALRHGWSCVPVVPCDEAAVQRAAAASWRWMRQLGESDYDRRVRIVREVLRAAAKPDVPTPVSTRCARLLIGQGDDTYDPVCALPAGHDGRCKPVCDSCADGTHDECQDAADGCECHVIQ